MKVYVFALSPCGYAPSQRFRHEQYTQFFNQKGVSLVTLPFYSESTYQILYQRGYWSMKAWGLFYGYVRRIVDLFKLIDTPVVFIHREMAPLGPPIFEWVIAKVLKKKIIYDFDDAIWRSQYTQEVKWIRFLKNPSKVNLIIRWSWKVSCGNDYLVAHALKYNTSVFLNPTTVDTDTRYAEVKDQHSSDVVVGWTGSHSTLMYLEALVPLLEKVYDKVPFRFTIICDRPLSYMPSFATFIPWKEETEIEDLLNFNIGIMPLVEDPWTEGKCGFKAIQYMALAIPALVSPVGVNKQIVDHGINGYICATDQEWESALTTLIQNEALRIEMGLKAREKIIQHYSVSSNKTNFLSFFKDQN